MKWLPANFNDFFALILDVIVIPVLWIVWGTGYILIPETALGATIPIWTLVAQYYFRKAKGGS